MIDLFVCLYSLKEEEAEEKRNVTDSESVNNNNNNRRKVNIYIVFTSHTVVKAWNDFFVIEIFTQRRNDPDLFSQATNQKPEQSYVIK